MLQSGPQGAVRGRGTRGVRVPAWEDLRKDRRAKAETSVPAARHHQNGRRLVIKIVIGSDQD